VSWLRDAVPIWGRYRRLEGKGISLKYRSSDPHPMSATYYPLTLATSHTLSNISFLVYKIRRNPNEGTGKMK
jgi:hypothetical protein